jgi:enamine deaminase RidA (YjgF/YER057c/UK114 family)
MQDRGVRWVTQPAGTFLAVTALAWPGMLIEIDATASTAQ